MIGCHLRFMTERLPNLHPFDHHGIEPRQRSGSAEWEVATGTLDTQPISFLTPGVWMEGQTGAFFSMLSRWGHSELQTALLMPPRLAAHSALGNETPRVGWTLVRVTLCEGFKSKKDLDLEKLLIKVEIVNVGQNKEIWRGTTHLSISVVRMAGTAHHIGHHLGTA